MHGIIHAELKKYVETNHGPEAWRAILDKAGLGNKIYMAVSTYEDAEAVAIVRAASALTGVPPLEILEDFGLFIAPDLLGMYKSLIDPSWKTADLFVNVEDTIHTVVRMKNPGATPPNLKFKRVGPNELHFHYDSPRQMSSVAKGIMKGVADHYGEKLDIKERKNEDGSIDMRILVSPK